MLHDTQNNNERRISLNTADVEALRRLLRLVENSGGSDLQPHRGIGVPDHGLVQVARLILQGRRRRSRQFKLSMFGEPAWDMLLVLYANGLDGARLSIGRLSELAGSAPTTAIRWLDYLVGEQLVARRENPCDARSEFVDLTEKGRSAMEQYLSETLDSLR